VSRAILCDPTIWEHALSEEPGDITVLLQRMRAGESVAADELMPRIMHELRRLARAYLSSERTGHTLQPTALVNEAYIRFVGDQPDWQNRAHFIGVAASVMRRILIEYARRRQATKRGNEPTVVRLDEQYDMLSEQQSEEILELDCALDRLEKQSPRHRRVVELRYFGGLSVEETAEVLGVSAITVKRDWLAARSWLRAEMRPELNASSAGHGA
jgi:RNA polymerase sigma-70 factor (ECF subfamily)